MERSPTTNRRQPCQISISTASTTVSTASTTGWTTATTSPVASSPSTRTFRTMKRSDDGKDLLGVHQPFRRGGAGGTNQVVHPHPLPAGAAGIVLPAAR